MVLEASAPPGSTVAADKGYDVASFVTTVRGLTLTPLWVSTPTITFRASGWIVLWFVTGWPPRVLVRRPDGRTGL